VALTASDLIYPNGDLLPSMFPDGDINTAVGVWLADAIGKTASESAQRHWVYHRAYTVIANRIASTPSNESSFDNHTVAWSDNRVSAFEKKATKHLAEYGRISGDDTMSSTRPASLRVY
jgi:hypothetical protein